MLKYHLKNLDISIKIRSLNDLSKNHQLTNINICGKFHACIRNSTILALSRLAIRSIYRILLTFFANFLP